MKIGIIGAGWYGCHLALALKKAGHDVTIYEKTDKIFSQISGSFGIRLHAGPHYPRSEETRKSCHRSFEEFIATYPELVIPHEYSIYAIGKRDAEGNPPKVSDAQFKSVCEESDTCEQINLEEYGYQELYNAYNIEEPSIALGDKLRKTFEQYLIDANIPVVYNFEVTETKPTDSGKILLKGNNETHEFDKIINASSYQSQMVNQEDFPFDMEVVYQPCLALKYKDKNPGPKPFSFIVMDGWFPCIMPVVTDDEQPENVDRNYILTHGKWTIMGSYSNPQDAKKTLESLTDDFVAKKIKKPSEQEAARFWPEFTDRFEYDGWHGQVLAKLKTKSEFRSAVTFEKEGLIHIIPGKVSNIFDAEREVMSLLLEENVLEAQQIKYIKGGVLDTSQQEISEKPSQDEPNTANLQTFDELTKQISETNKQSHNPNTFFNAPKNQNTNSLISIYTMLITETVISSMVFIFNLLKALTFWMLAQNIAEEKIGTTPSASI